MKIWKKIPKRILKKLIKTENDLNIKLKEYDLNIKEAKEQINLKKTELSKLKKKIINIKNI